MQTFVLAPQGQKKYYVYNDIFRYQDEVFTEGGDNEENHETIEGGVAQPVGVAAPTEDDDEDDGPPPSDGIATVSIIDGHQEASPSIPHVNGGGASAATPTNSVDISPRVPIEPPVRPTEVDPPTSMATPPSVADPAPKPPEEPAATPPTVKGDNESASTVEATPISEEKPTYANLFKKAGGGGASTLVAGSGPPSLPPSGFAKSSQQQNSSPPTANNKEGSPNSGFQANKGFRGGRGGGGGGANSGRGGGMSSRDRYHASRESVSSNANDDQVTPSSGGGSGREEKGRGSRMEGSLANYPDTHQVFVGNLPHHCQTSDLEELFSKFGKVMRLLKKKVICPLGPLHLQTFPLLDICPSGRLIRWTFSLPDICHFEHFPFQTFGH